MNKKNGEIENLIGKIFNKLTVIALSSKRHKSNNKPLWICKCECGNETTVLGYSLKRGNTKSCGCWKHTFCRKENSSLTQKYSLYKRDAKKRKVFFNLTKEEFENIITKSCYYCGENPKPWSQYIKSDGSFAKVVNTGHINHEYAKSTIININGIDRLNNLNGYNVDNCVSSCFTCNMMKKTLGEKEFLQHIKKIYNHSINN